MAEQWTGPGLWWGQSDNPFRVPAPTSTRYSGGQFPKTPIGTKLLEDQQNRLAAFTYYNQQRGINPLTNIGQFYQRIYPQLSSGYEAALAEDPELTFQKYYHLIYPQLQAAYQNLTPDQRGQNITRFVGPARIVPRGIA